MSTFPEKLAHCWHPVAYTHAVNTGPFSWNSDASRQIENFTDFGHFPWVHPGLLGDPERPIVPDHTVEIRASAI